MSDILITAQAIAAGFLLGVLFFGGLAWTTRKALTAGNPALWFLGSRLLRIAAVMTGFYLVSGGRWQRLLICLAGFTMARIVVVRLNLPAGKHDAGEREAPHATKSR